MVSERIVLWKDEEYSYPMGCGFVPFMVSYLHEDEKVRPCMLVVPGGGYCVVSPTEGKIVADPFYEEGYNVFVLVYTTNLLMRAPLKLQPLADISRAVRMIRKNAADYRIDPDKLAICGFSAGAHLCGSLCVHFQDMEDQEAAYAGISNRPDAAILSYPVITSGEFAHRGSFIALLGQDASPEELEYMSLEKQVTKDTPPCFLWQTATDEAVPVENSYLFAESLRHAGVTCAHHVFTQGPHGLSVANEAWMRGEYGDPYCMEQNFKLLELAKKDTLGLTKEQKEALLSQFSPDSHPTQAKTPEQEESFRDVFSEVGIWPQLAIQWLAKIWRKK